MSGRQVSAFLFLSSEVVGGSMVLLSGVFVSLVMVFVIAWSSMLCCLFQSVKSCLSVVCYVSVRIWMVCM